MTYPSGLKVSIKLLKRYSPPLCVHKVPIEQSHALVVINSNSLNLLKTSDLFSMK